MSVQKINLIFKFIGSKQSYYFTDEKNFKIAFIYWFVKNKRFVFMVIYFLKASVM